MDAALIDSRIQSLEDELRDLRAMRDASPCSFDDWVRDVGARYFPGEAVCPVNFYPNYGQSVDDAIARLGRGYQRMFKDGEEPVYMRGSRARITKGKRSKFAGAWLERLCARVVGFDRKTLWTVAEWREYSRFVMGKALDHFKKRGIYIDSRTVAACGVHVGQIGGGDIGLDSDYPSFLFKGRVKNVISSHGDIFSDHPQARADIEARAKVLMDFSRIDKKLSKLPLPA